MSGSPVVSIVVPVYNGARDLPGCLASVRAAVDALPATDHDRVEVIVCDNWSDDGSRDIAEGFEIACAYRVLSPEQHEPNRTRNWRAGIATATGDWVMMLHADDLMARGALGALLKATARPEAGSATLINGRHRTFEDPAQPSGLHPVLSATALVPGGPLSRTVLSLHCPFVPFVLMRREAYEAVGGLDEQWELVQDWHLWIRLAGRGDLLFVTDEIGLWRLHPTSPKYREINAREHVQLSRQMPDIIGRLRPSWAARARRVALARAAVQLDGLDADPAPWLGSDRLPDVRTAHATLRRTLRQVAITLLALRALGVPRRVAPRARRGT